MTRQPQTPLPAPPLADPMRPLPDKIWLHGLTVLLFVLLVNLAQAVLGICAILQFGWMLFARERNPAIARLGNWVGDWLLTAARFTSGADDIRPFPWPDRERPSAEHDPQN